MSFIRRTVVKALSDDQNSSPRDIQKSDAPFIGRLKLVMVSKKKKKTFVVLFVCF